MSIIGSGCFIITPGKTRDIVQSALGKISIIGIYSTVKFKLMKTKFPFFFLSFPPPVSHKFTFSHTWGKLISPPGNSVLPLGKHNFPPIPPEFLLNFPRNSPEFPWFPNHSPWFPCYMCSFQYTFTSVHCLWALGLFYAYYMYLWKWEFYIMWDKEL